MKWKKTTLVSLCYKTSNHWIWKEIIKGHDYAGNQQSETVIWYKLFFVLQTSLQDWHKSNSGICINATTPRLEEAFLKHGKLEYLAEKANLTFNWHFWDQVKKKKKIISKGQVAFCSENKTSRWVRWHCSDERWQDRWETVAFY